MSFNIRPELNAAAARVIQMKQETGADFDSLIAKEASLKGYDKYEDTIRSLCGITNTSFAAKTGSVDFDKADPFKVMAILGERSRVVKTAYDYPEYKPSINFNTMEVDHKLVISNNLTKSASSDDVSKPINIVGVLREKAQADLQEMVYKSAGLHNDMSKAYRGIMESMSFLKSAGYSKDEVSEKTKLASNTHTILNVFDEINIKPDPHIDRLAFNTEPHFVKLASLVPGFTKAAGEYAEVKKEIPNREKIVNDLFAVAEVTL